MMLSSVIIPNYKTMQDFENDLEEKAIDFQSSEGFIDIIDFSLDLGLKVFQINTEDENFNAEIEYFPNNDSFEILVNGNQSINRQRFSIGHQVSHFLLHKSVIMDRKKLHRTGYCNNNIDSDMERLIF